MIDKEIYAYALFMVMTVPTLAMLAVVTTLRGAKFASGSQRVFGLYFLIGTLGWAQQGISVAMDLPVKLEWGMAITLLCALLLLLATGIVGWHPLPMSIAVALMGAATAVLLVFDELATQALWLGLCSAVAFAPLVWVLVRRARVDRNIGEAIIALGAGFVVFALPLELLGYLHPEWDELLYGGLMVSNSAGFLLVGIGFLSSMLIEEHKQLTALALNDPLTGLLNRRGLQHDQLRAAASLDSTHPGSCVIVCDIDHFKRINDSLGHDGGDAVLVAFSALLTSSVRDGDVCCRLGGEEFLVVLRATPMEQATRLAGRLRERVEALCVAFKDTEIRLTASFGVACGMSGQDIDTLIKAADKALYQAKADGRNRVVEAQA